MHQFKLKLSQIGIISIFFCILFNSVQAEEKINSSYESIEQLIIINFQQMLFKAYGYKSEKIDFKELSNRPVSNNFPIIIGVNDFAIKKQNYSSERFFSRLNAMNFQNKSKNLKAKQALIKISNRPVNQGYLSSGFGYRKDPINGFRRMHKGIDIAASLGSAVNPLGKGIVKFSGYKSGFGNMVEIEHGKTVSTRYAHLKKVLVDTNQEVEAKDTIGLVGSSGRSTGPHLHLEVLFNGKQVDPQVFLASHFGTDKKIINKQPRIKAQIILSKAPKQEFPQINNFPQVTYQEYVNSVDGLFGFTAPTNINQ